MTQHLEIIYRRSNGDDTLMTFTVSHAEYQRRKKTYRNSGTIMVRNTGSVFSKYALTQKEPKPVYSLKSVLCLESDIPISGTIPERIESE